MSVLPGELIMRAEPYVHVLSQKERGQRCDFCFSRESDLRRCSSCKLLRYCNVKCQKFDWSIHKEECPCLQAVSPKIPLDSVRLLFRLIIRHKRGDDTRQTDNDPSWRTFSQFQSHAKEIEQDKKRSQIFSELMYTLSKMAGSSFNLPDAREIFDLYGKMTINSFSICDGEMQAIGVGIYLSPSMLDHSCQSNAVVTFNGKLLEVRATESIPEVTPHTVFISYIDQLSTSAERHTQLEEQYYFTCQCPRCTASDLDHLMESFQCLESGCSGFVYKENDVSLSLCNVCNTKPESSYMSEVDGLIVYSKEQLKKIEEEKKRGNAKTVLELCKACLEKQESVMSLYNVHMVRVLDKAFDAAIDLEMWEEALDYGRRTTSPYLKLYPPGSPNVGVQLMKIGKIQLYLHQLTEATTSLNKAESILRITHGTSSSLYKDLGELIDSCREESRIELVLCGTD